MSDHSPMATLIDLAKKEAEQFAQRLGAALRVHQDNEQKLTLLLQYREDYAKRYQQGMTNGLNIAHHQNFRDFLGKLDEAILGQQTLVDQALRHVDAERNAWQTAERKRLSFSTLAQRTQQQQQQRELRREQKLSDEYAMRIAQRQAANATSLPDTDL